MPRKPAHERFDTLAAIETRAFELFGRFGYEGVSIGDIAKAARISKGALYWHFSGKEELYLDCLKRLHAIFDSYILEPMRREPDPIRSIMLLFSGLQRMLQDPRVENGIAGYWLTPSTPETAQIDAAQRAFEAGAIAILRDVLQRGVDRRQLDFAGDLDELARATISLVEACVLPLRHRSADEVHGMLAVMARTMFRAYARSDDVLRLAFP
ncbi:helix-turn-helix domain-containing protein [Fontimonas sp. SYSU GA230001]|uniref:helix-turn-helix domain-containing protein n=1 Tax=Fontimonas sp. SYSU GA230001 TaxID=3142450 RepID=UPI0032B58653